MRVLSSENIFCIVKEIWQQELSAGDFSPTDDFFELGGNSLKLISILDKLQKNNELTGMKNLTIIELFDCPVLKDLIILIESKIQIVNCNE